MEEPLRGVVLTGSSASLGMTVFCSLFVLSVFTFSTAGWKPALRYRAARAAALLRRFRAQNRLGKKSSPSVLPVNLRILVEMAKWRRARIQEYRFFTMKILKSMKKILKNGKRKRR